MNEETALAVKEKSLPQKVVEAISEVATEKALEIWKAQEDTKQKELRNERVTETKRLFRTYKANKAAVAMDRGYTEAEKAELRLNFLEDLMGKPDQGLLRSERQIYNDEHRIAKRLVEIQRVEQAMEIYKRETDLSRQEEQQRRYRMVCMRYLDDMTKDEEEIAMIELVSEKTVYRDLRKSMEILSEYIFGY